MDSVAYRAGDLSGSFGVAINFNKTMAEFCEHEKATGFTKEELKEVYDLIQQAGKKAGLVKAKAEKKEEKPME